MPPRKVFAREPIRPKSGAPPKGNQQNLEIKSHKIDKAFIERFHKATVETNLANVLVLTSSSLGFKISSQGNTDTFITGPNGHVIADNRDVQAITGMNTFVQNERKAATKEKVTGGFMKVLFALASKSSLTADLPLWDNSFLSVYKPVEALLKTLSKNMEQISSVPTEGTEEIIRRHITASNTRIRNAIGRFLIAKFDRIDGDKKLNDFYFEAHVPMWVVNRLTQSFVDLKNSKGGLTSFYFPRDLSKGLTLSYKEITSPSFTGDQAGLLTGNEEIVSFFGRKENILPFLAIDSESKLLTDEEAFANELANVPIMMIPPECSRDLVIDIARKTGVKGYSWSVGRTISPKDNLRFLGTIFKRAHFLALPNPRQQVVLIEDMFPGFKFDRNSADKDPFVQLAKHLDESADDKDLSAYFSDREMVSNVDARKAHRRVILQILGLPEAHTSEVETINRFFGLKWTYDLPDSCELEPVAAFTRATIRVHAEVLTDTWGELSHLISSADPESVAVKGILAKVYKKPNLKEKKQLPLNLANVRTTLGQNASLLVEQLKQRKEKSLADRIAAWFQNFLSVQIQEACARLLSARFQVVFNETISYSAEDYAGIVDYAGLDSGGLHEPFQERGDDSEDSELEADDDEGPPT